MSTGIKGLSVETYEKMVRKGILPETNRFELIRGRIVEKDVKGPDHRIATRNALKVIDRLLPAGWHANKEEPVGVPGSKSEPEPDVSVVRGEPEDYSDRNPWRCRRRPGGRGHAHQHCEGSEAVARVRGRRHPSLLDHQPTTAAA